VKYELAAADGTVRTHRSRYLGARRARLQFSRPIGHHVVAGA
jgi:hypothetical protein